MPFLVIENIMENVGREDSNREIFELILLPYLRSKLKELCHVYIEMTEI